MSTPNEQPLDTAMEAAVARYLREHPEFFERHLGLLAELRVPHASGGAVSIVERQVALLRQRLDEKEQVLHELLEAAKRNERLSGRFNDLILELLGADTLEAVLDTVQRRLQEDFGADAVTLRVFDKAARAGDARRPEFADWSEPVLGAFEKVVHERKPVCGRLKPGQLESLFADQAEPVRSAALIPLAEGVAERPVYGLLAVGSFDPERFNPRMGTLFLEQIAGVLTRVLRRHLR